MEGAAAAAATPAIMWSAIRNAALEIHTDIPRPANCDPDRADLQMIKLQHAESCVAIELFLANLVS
jgi:hypothetical protein